MTVEQVIALTIGFFFGWLGEWYESRKRGKESYRLGFQRGMEEMASVTNACCARCEETGEPDPVVIEFGRLSDD